MTITRTRSVAALRKVSRTKAALRKVGRKPITKANAKSKRLAAERAEASAVAIEPPTFGRMLLDGTSAVAAASFQLVSQGSLAAHAIAAVSFRLLMSQSAQAKPTEEAKFKLRAAKLKRREALRDMARAEHALNMARIELEHSDAKLAKLEQLEAPASLWTRVSTAATYVTIGAVVASNPGATYAVVEACTNVAAIAGRYTLAMAY